MAIRAPDGANNDNDDNDNNNLSFFSRYHVKACLGSCLCLCAHLCLFLLHVMFPQVSCLLINNQKGHICLQLSSALKKSKGVPSLSE